jgi:dUTPase
MKIKRISPLALIPTRATDGSAGYDLRAIYNYDVQLATPEFELVENLWTRLSVELVGLVVHDDQSNP